jgi:RNA-directed DNA polymerase
VDVDIKSYFDTIEHGKLMSLIELQISDGRLLDLIRTFLKQGCLCRLHRPNPEP